MDIIASLDENAPIPAVIQPTADAFIPLLEKRRAEIESVASKTFRYGQAERHDLDVYYPPADALSSGPVPVLFFAYGGGFTQGARRYDPPRDLLYANLGAFFAKRGILTVVPDYRLVPEVKFPEPVEDVRDALAWFLSNARSVAAAAPAGSSFSLDKPDLFVMGHSAGANLVTSLYLLPSLLPLSSPIRAATRGLIVVGGGLNIDPQRPLMPPGVLEHLFGSQERARELMPVSLLAKADEEVVRSLPDVLVLVSERDPALIKEASDDFVKGLEDRTGKKVPYDVMKGHNHLSPHMALYTGQGEEWAVQVAEWVKSRV
ncbi:alpha/beta hydrolase domain-containing protein [Trametes punicea]|nr:alpha/beta hydrolase domain-containing protein [Trametes punicea]